MEKRYYAHERPELSGRPWVKVIVHLADGRRLRGSYHGNGKFYVNGAIVTDSVVYWEYD